MNFKLQNPAYNLPITIGYIPLFLGIKFFIKIFKNITIGIAKIAPTTPRKLEKTKKDRRIKTGLKPETFCITLGTKKLFSNT